MRVVSRLNVAEEGDSSPRFLHISYSDSHAQAQVTRSLRLAWSYLPPAERPTSRTMLVDSETMRLRDPGEAGSFVKDAISKSDEEMAEMPKNPDLTSIHTDWRDKVYGFWPHVFYDVVGWLGTQFDSSSGVGHYHPPNSEGFGAEHGSTRKWDTDILLTPAHLQPGLKIQMSIVDPEASPVSAAPSKGSAAFTWDDSTRTDICYVRRGTSVRFDVEDQGDDDGTSNATAAMVLGALCSERHDPDDPPGRPEQKALMKEEMEEEELQEEVQSSMGLAMAMALSAQARKAAS